MLASIEDGIDTNTNKKKKELETGLDFILSHLEEPTIFPRTIMTKIRISADSLFKRKSVRTFHRI